MTVKAKSAFKAQRIPRAEADGFYVFVCKQGFGQSHGIGVWDGDFITVFARVARAGDPAFRAVQIKRGDVHEGHVSSSGIERAEHSLRRWTLQRKERAVGDFGDCDFRLKVRFHVGDVSAFAGGVDHHEDMIATIGKHQVIHDAALFIGEHAIALAVFCKTFDIDWDQRFQSGSGHRPRDFDLTHMADVKQSRFLACVHMFFHHTKGKLHGHGVPCERHHFRTQLNVQIVQRCL